MHPARPLSCLSLCVLCLLASGKPPDGNAVIRSKVGDSEVIIGTKDLCARTMKRLHERAEK